MQFKNVVVMTMVSAQLQDPVNTVKSLCASGTKSAYCEVFTSLCVGDNMAICDSSNLTKMLSVMCSSDFGGNSECEAVKTYCSSNSEACAPTTLWSSIPSNTDLTAKIKATCAEMPDMDACKMCPSSDAAVYDCPIFKTYSMLCMDMVLYTNLARNVRMSCMEIILSTI